MTTITAVTAHDVRFPTSLSMDGSDAMNKDGDYSAAYVVIHTDDPELKTGAKFKPAGIQVAAGVPLQCGEPDDFSTFRLGLFGLDKLTDVDGTVQRFQDALAKLAD